MKDFRNFMHKSWMTWFGNPPTARMYEVGERLQHGPSKDIVMGFRGLSKSFITVDFCVWSLDVDPTEIVLALSGSDKGAKGNAFLAWSVITGWDWLAHMKPSGQLRQSAQAFDVAGSRMEKCESFTANSLFGDNTGKRASLVLPDDIETPNTSETQGDRDRLRTRYQEIGGAILKPGGRIKVLGTPQHEQTVYSELATEKGYGLRIWPLLYPKADPDPKKDELRKYGPWLAPTIIAELAANPELAGTSTEPTRFPEAEILERRKEYGLIEFQRQFLLWMDAGTGNATPLKWRDIPVIEIERPDPTRNAPLLVPSSIQWSPLPANLYGDIEIDSLGGDSHVYAPNLSSRDENFWQEPESKVLIVDPSGEGADETAWVVLTQHLGLVGLVDMDARLEGFSAPTMKAIAECAKAWGVHKIVIEKNYGGGMFGELLRPHLFDVGHPCTIEEEIAGQVQKEVRIVDTLVGVVTDHRLWVSAEVVRKDFKVDYPDIEQAKRRYYRLTYQLSRITKVRGALAHDDRLDALATGVSKFQGMLRRQREEAQAQSREAYLQKQAEAIIELRRKQGAPLFGLEAGPSKLGNFIGATAKDMAHSAFFTGRQR